MRRALYDRLTSVRRAELHLRVGEALERRHNAGLDRFAADLAHHFTMAAALVGAARAVAYNVRAARAAMDSLAYEQAAENLTTAISLGIDDEVAEFACEVAFALMDTRNLSEAERLVTRAIEAGEEVLTPGIRAHLSIVRGHLRLRRHPDAAQEVRALAGDAIPTLTEGHRHRGLAHAWRLTALAGTFDCRWGDVEQALRCALEHAERAGDLREQATLVSWLVAALYNGPARAAEAIRECESMLARFAGDPVVEARMACHLAVLLAMRGRFDVAHETADRSTTVLEERGLRTPCAVARAVVSEIDMLRGDPASAERQLIAAYEALASSGEDAIADAAALDIARALCAQGRFSEAESGPLLAEGSYIRSI